MIKFFLKIISLVFFFLIMIKRGMGLIYNKYKLNIQRKKSNEKIIFFP
jgi:hypothetical protein